VLCGWTRTQPRKPSTIPGMKFMKNKNTSLVYVIDKNFIPHFTTSLTSLLVQNASLFDDIYVVTNFPQNKKMEKSLEFFKTKFKKNVEVINIDNSKISQMKILKKDHLTLVTYARLLLSEILPEKIERVLYLDADLIILGQLDELCNTEFDGKYLIAVNEYHWTKKSGPEVLTKKELINENYFNSGVMLINLKRWREESMANTLIGIGVENRKDLVYWDQDVLNITFKNKWGETDKSFNALELTSKVTPHPIVVHFTGPIKPWHVLSSHPYKKLYLNYRKMTPFKMYPSLGISLYSLVGQILSRNVYTNKLVKIKQVIKL
jgi:lipopolysaccharide biosynthesis glycosyltransferase